MGLCKMSCPASLPSFCHLFITDTHTQTLHPYLLPVRTGPYRLLGVDPIGAAAALGKEAAAALHKEAAAAPSLGKEAAAALGKEAAKRLLFVDF